jgi:hypothetical protein
MTEEKVEPPPPATNPKPDADILQYPLGALGAILGAAAGIFIVKVAWSSGFYAIIAVGILSGLVAGWFAKRGGWTVGAIAGLVTLAASIWAEWKFVGAMRVDDSFTYFLTHFHQLSPFKLLMHTVNVAIAVWMGARR